MFMFKEFSRVRVPVKKLLNIQILCCAGNCISCVLSQLQEEHDGKDDPIVFHVCDEHYYQVLYLGDITVANETETLA